MATTRELAIPIPHEAIADFCRKWGVHRLSFFGSIVRDDFDPERSDVDVLVQFRPGQTPGWAIVSAEDELAKILGRKSRSAHAGGSQPVDDQGCSGRSDRGV